MFPLGKGCGDQISQQRPANPVLAPCLSPSADASQGWPDLARSACNGKDFAHRTSGKPSDQVVHYEMMSSCVKPANGRSTTSRVQATASPGRSAPCWLTT